MTTANDNPERSDHSTIGRVLALHTVTPEGKLTEQMLSASEPNFAFYFMLGLAASIATLGLVANSAPAIIGAMIVAPLMSPIIGFSFGAVISHGKMIITSVFSIVTGVVLVIMIGFFLTKIFGMRVAGSEILARTAPSTLDLGVALAAGGAAAFAHTRSHIANSIAGVAIAVALVPPLAVCGIGLSLGDKAVAERGMSLAEFGLTGGGWDIATGSFVLFATNIVGIIAIAMIVFLLQRYGHWKRAVIMLFTILLVAVFIVQSLDERLRTIYVKDRVQRVYAKLAQDRPDVISGQAMIESVHVSRVDGDLHVYMFVVGPRSRLAAGPEAVEEFRQILSDDVGEPVTMVVEAIPVDFVRVIKRPPQAGEAGGNDDGAERFEADETETKVDQSVDEGEPAQRME